MEGSEKISFDVDRGEVTIVGGYAKGEKGAPAFLLLHMMPSTKESWTLFMEKAAERKCHVLAIDLRGHGESTHGIHIPEGSDRWVEYKRFENADHQASIRDVYAAAAWLKEKGVDENSLVVGGASIGANLALWYASENPDTKGCFALSPGLNYRGIEALPYAKKIKSNQKVLIAAARDDERSGGGADMQAEKIHRELSAEHNLIIYESGGHGTDMFQKHDELADAILEWFS